MSIHPGAALFPEEARRNVAEGPLFDKGDALPVNEDECCVIGALLFAAKPDLPHILFYEVPDPPAVLAELGLRYATQEESDHVCRNIARLMHRNDRGHYAGPDGRANLYADLLGEQPAAQVRGALATGEGEVAG